MQIMWGKTKKGQPYPKIDFKKGMSGQDMKTQPTNDVHMKEHNSHNSNVMTEFAGAEVIVPDPDLNLWFVWFGGQSHYVHIYDHSGKELDVFSWGFEQNNLSAVDVKKHIKQHIEEMNKENR